MRNRLSGANDQMATSTLANAVANAVTAMTSSADFAAAKSALEVIAVTALATALARVLVAIWSLAPDNLLRMEYGKDQGWAVRCPRA